MRLLPCGSDAILVELAGLEPTLALHRALRADPPQGCRALIPAARTILIRFDPFLTTAEALAQDLRQRQTTEAAVAIGQEIEIAVHYDGQDLAEVAHLTSLSEVEVIERHTAILWQVAFNGFAPGFSYLTGCDPALEVPRRQSPRAAIPPGSVALAGRFSGIYPKASPGGWQIIGTTDAQMWDDTRTPPALLQPGDRVRFVPTPARPRPRPARPPVPPPAAAPGFTLLAAPLPVLVQDGGRLGLVEQGISASGVLDQGALVQLNDLLGNPAGQAALEITGGGLRLRSDVAAVIAVTGAPCTITLNDRLHFASHRPIPLDAGDTLHLSAPTFGLRSLLGVRGGFDVAAVLGSAATDTLAGIGPAPLRAGDRIGLAKARAGAVGAPLPPAPALPRAGDLIEVEVILGPRADWFPPDTRARFCAQAWRVTPQSNRIGLRLEGAALTRPDQRELPSEGAVAGAIQVPHDGQPVLFLADHPLTGGYPVIAVVAAHQLDLLGQIPPGAHLRFRPRAPFAALHPPSEPPPPCTAS